MSFSGTPDPQRHRHAVAGAGVGVRRARVEPARAAGGEDHRLRADRLQAAVQDVPADHALAAVVVDDELPGEVLLVDLEVALHHLLVEHVDEDVAGDVGRVGGARLAGGAERPLRDPAVLGAREDGAPVLELVDVVGRLVAEDLDRVLVAEVVGALDRVEGVLLGIVLGGVPERRVDAALGGAGVAADRMDLRDERDVRARVVCLDGGAHAGAAGADDQHVVLRFHHEQDAITKQRARALVAYERLRASRHGLRIFDEPADSSDGRSKSSGEDAVPASRGGRAIENPSPEEAKELAAQMPTARPTRYGNLNVQTEVARALEALHLHRHRRARRPAPGDLRATRGSRWAEAQDAYIADQEMVAVDGYIGNDPELRVAGPALHRGGEREHRRHAAAALLPAATATASSPS